MPIFEMVQGKGQNHKYAFRHSPRSLNSIACASPVEAVIHRSHHSKAACHPVTDTTPAHDEYVDTPCIPVDQLGHASQGVLELIMACAWVGNNALRLLGLWSWSGMKGQQVQLRTSLTSTLQEDQAGSS